MDLRLEINSSPHGTKARLERTTGLSKPTILNALSGKSCSPATARDIAVAFGQPERWPELVVITRPPRTVHVPTSPTSAAA